MIFLPHALPLRCLPQEVEHRASTPDGALDVARASANGRLTLRWPRLSYCLWCVNRFSASSAQPEFTYGSTLF